MQATDLIKRLDGTAEWEAEVEAMTEEELEEMSMMAEPQEPTGMYDHRGQEVVGKQRLTKAWVDPAKKANKKKMARKSKKKNRKKK